MPWPSSKPPGGGGGAHDSTSAELGGIVYADADADADADAGGGSVPAPGSGAARAHARKLVPPRKLLLGDGAPRRAKHHNPWALEESEALVEGVARCGGGRWADIKKLGFSAIEHRTAVDLKDKWRNLLRIALLPSSTGGGGGGLLLGGGGLGSPGGKSGASAAAEKRREIPSALLARVRHLAATQGKARGGGVVGAAGGIVGVAVGADGRPVRSMRAVKASTPESGSDD